MPMSDEIAALTTEVANLNTTVAGERQAKKWAVRIVGVLLIVVLGIAAFALDAARTSQSAVDQVVDQRSDARVTACEKDRDDAVRFNNLLDRSKGLLDDTFNAPRESPRTPDAQAAVDAYLADQFAKYDALRTPVRKCDRQSIEDYYERNSS